MTLPRSISSRVRRAVIPMPVLAGLFVAVSHAGALPAPPLDRSRGDRTLFTWTGRVDREVLIVVRGRDVSTRGFDAALPSRTRVTSALPRTRAYVVAVLDDGRGDVDGIEQPCATRAPAPTATASPPTSMSVATMTATAATGHGGAAVVVMARCSPVVVVMVTTTGAAATTGAAVPAR